MTLDRSYIGYLGFLGIDLFKSVLMYSNGAICLIKLVFKIGLFTVWLECFVQPIWPFFFMSVNTASSVAHQIPPTQRIFVLNPWLSQNEFLEAVRAAHHPCGGGGWNYSRSCDSSLSG
jgi:hypothetical protein